MGSEHALIKLFQQNLSAKSRESLCKLLELQDAEEGEDIVVEGELGTKFFVVFRGTCKVKYVSRMVVAQPCCLTGCQQR